MLANGKCGKCSLTEGGVMDDTTTNEWYMATIGHRRQLVCKHSYVGHHWSNGNCHRQWQCLKGRRYCLLMAIVCKAQCSSTDAHQCMRRWSHSGHFFRTEWDARHANAEEKPGGGQRFTPVADTAFNRHSPTASMRYRLARKCRRWEAPRRQILARNTWHQLWLGRRCRRQYVGYDWVTSTYTIVCNKPQKRLRKRET